MHASSRSGYRDTDFFWAIDRLPALWEVCPIPDVIERFLAPASRRILMCRRARYRVAGTPGAPGPHYAQILDC